MAALKSAALKKASFPNADNLQAVGDLIVSSLNTHDVVSRPEASSMVIVKYKDGSFKKKTISPTWDFFITGSRIGKSENLLFIAETQDQSEFNSDGVKAEKWQHVELSLDDMDKVFPMILPQLSEWIDTKETMAKTVRFLYDRLTVSELMEEADSATKLQDLPTYGMF